MLQSHRTLGKKYEIPIFVRSHNRGNRRSWARVQAPVRRICLAAGLLFAVGCDRGGSTTVKAAPARPPVTRPVPEGIRPVPIVPKARGADTPEVFAYEDLARDPATRVRVSEALRQAAGSEGLSRAIESLLADPDPDARALAARAARSLGDGGAALVPTLSAALRDPEFRVRREACEALRALGATAKDAAPALVEAMLDPARRIQHLALFAVLALGASADAAVAASLENPDPVLAARVFDKLESGYEGGAAIAERALLAALRKAAAPAVRAQAARVAGRREFDGAARLQALLSAAVGDEDAGVRRAAAEAIQQAPPDSREAIVRALNEGRNDPDPAAREAILRALRRFGGEKRQ